MLSNFQSLSQRDPQWANIKLGTSTSTTIGSHGCTLTCLSIFSKTTPDKLNKILINGGAFANQNLIYWGKLEGATAGKITFIERGWNYDNDKVSQAIKDYGACLVEVDGSRIGASKHWVLYIGNQQMIDPWFGTVKATGYYRPTGFSIIKVREDQPQNTDELTSMRLERDRNWNLYQESEKKAQGLEEQTGQLRDKIAELEGRVTGATTRAKTAEENYQRIIDRMAQKLGSVADEGRILEQVERDVSELDSAQKKARELEKTLSALEDEKKLEIDALRTEISVLRNDNEKQLKRIDTLEKRVMTIHEQKEQASFLDRVRELVSFLRKDK